MGKKTVWVFYRWMQHGLHKKWVYIISSKASWQLNRAHKDTSEDATKVEYSFELLAESTDKAVLEKMKEMVKG